MEILLGCLFTVVLSLICLFSTCAAVRKPAKALTMAKPTAESTSGPKEPSLKSSAEQRVGTAGVDGAIDQLIEPRRKKRIENTMEIIEPREATTCTIEKRDKAPSATPAPIQQPTSLLTSSSSSAAATVGHDSATAAETTNEQIWASKLHQLDFKEMHREVLRKMSRCIASGVTTDVCRREENALKCRFGDVLVIDQTRVKLMDRSPDNDFIHANWVGSQEAGATKYICTQGPLPATQEDFWHMCFTEKSSAVLMLCDFTAYGQWRCSHYFPEQPNETKQFGPYTVTMKSKLDELGVADTHLSVMEIKCGAESHELKHCFHRAWPSALSTATEPILKLWRWVRAHHAGRPVVVHCSAGTNRAMTFIGLEYARDRVAKDPNVDFIDIVKELRHQRYQAIHTREHYLFLHILVLDSFVQDGTVVPVENSKFVGEIKRLVAQRAARAAVRRDRVPYHKCHPDDACSE